MRKSQTTGRAIAQGIFQRILLPVDLSERHSAALELAAKLVGRPDGVVILLHVIETIAGLPPDEDRGFYGRVEKAARTHLDRLAMALKGRRVHCESAIVVGHRAAEVVRYAGQAKADLIIATAPAVDPKNVTAGWGSLSHKISLLAPCPVLLVK